MRVIRLSLSALLMLSAPLAGAQIPPGYVAVARSANVPPDMLYALACAESGRFMPGGRVLPWPWSLNVAGVGQVFPSRAAAYAALVRVLERSSRIDIGLAQVNWHWHGERFADPWAALDPYNNLEIAAWILREQYERCACGDWWVAVERYHAPSDTEGAGERRSRYRALVMQCWQTSSGR